jgi:hypothetical protein
LGAPLLLLEAASRYRGDLEDRRTELLAVAFNEHTDFQGRLLERLGATDSHTAAEVTTQETVRGSKGTSRIDVLIRLSNEIGGSAGCVFIEVKFNPDNRPDAWWFTPGQASAQRAALDETSRHGSNRLVAIVSDCDLNNPRRPVPDEYDDVIGWREIAELAGESGGPTGWQSLARESTALASQRVLLEVWSYLKGDAVGALEDEDVAALARSGVAWDRVDALLRRLSEDLSWDGQVYTDWEIPDGPDVVYISGAPAPNSWLAEREDGWLYVALTDGLWESESPITEPQLYAGWGLPADAAARASLADSRWPSDVEQTGRVPVFDSEGVYVFGHQELRTFVHRRSTLTAQVGPILGWVRATIEATLAAPQPKF